MTPKTYPRYTVWRDYRTGDFEIVRWYNSTNYIIVQTNIRSRAKAHQSRLDWSQREKANEAETQSATSRGNSKSLSGRHIRKAIGLRIWRR
jgi:hypothetical protein